MPARVLYSSFDGIEYVSLFVRITEFSLIAQRLSTQTCLPLLIYSSLYLLTNRNPIAIVCPIILKRKKNLDDMKGLENQISTYHFFILKIMYCYTTGNVMPMFINEMTNITVPTGREATFTCIIEDIDGIKVSAVKKNVISHLIN